MKVFEVVQAMKDYEKKLMDHTEQSIMRAGDIAHFRCLLESAICEDETIRQKYFSTIDTLRDLIEECDGE